MTSATEETQAPTLSFTWDWSRAEHIRLHRQLLREARRTPRVRLLRWAVGLVLMVPVVMSIAGVMRGDGDLLRSGIPWLLLLGVWWGIFAWLMPRMSANAYLKFHRGPQRVTLTSEGVESGCDVCSNQLRWSAFQRMAETPEFLLFFYTSQCAVFIPRRVVPEQTLDEVRALVRSHLPAQG